MKVLHLIDSGGLYGAEKVLITLVSEQVQRGLEPMILSASRPGEGFKALDREAQSLGLPLIQWPMKPGFNMVEGFKIVRWAQQKGFSILHSHGYKFDILLAFLPNFLRRLPVIATTHGYTHTKLLSKLGLYSLVDRFALFFVEVSVTVSPLQRTLKLGPFRRERRVVENGISVSGICSVFDKENAQSERQKTTEDIYRVCAVGRLSPEKGFDKLIGAVAALRDRGRAIHLTLAGEGAERNFLEQEVRRYNISDYVEFSGYVSNITDLFRQSDLFVISSYTEGLPITLLEAMAFGIPVVATRVGAIPHVLDNGTAGRLISPFGIDDLENAIAECMSEKSQNKLSQSVIKARQILEKNYSSVAMSRKYESLYTSIAMT